MAQRYYAMPDSRAFVGGGGGGGSSIADIIMARGQAQADAELRGAAGWGDAIGGITQALSGGLQQYQQRKQEDQVQKAIRSAVQPQQRAAIGADVNGDPTQETTQAPDVRSILDGLPPELQAR